MSEQLSLKWNDYQENISSSYMELRKSQEFGDVTLVCEDNYKIEAHRLILASGSKFFRNTLFGNNHAHPFIYMRGIKAKDLECLVGFIYNGETNMYEEDLNDFLVIAEELNLKGLCDSTRSDEALHSRKETKVKPFMKESHSNPLISISSPNVYASKPETLNEEVVNNSFVKTVSVPNINSDMDTNTSVSFKCENTELDTKINLMLKKINNIWTCTMCGKTDNNNRVYNVKKHIESHIEGQAHPCEHCGKTFRYINLLQSHMSRIHKC